MASTNRHLHDWGVRRSASRRRLTAVLVFTTVFLVVEVIGAIAANSLALLADAGHMVSDVGAIALALFALWYAERPATARRTYGYARAEILAAMLNALALILIVAYVFWQAWHRFWNPPEVESGPMLVVALAGLGVNLVGAWILAGGRRESLNEEGAYLHALGDALGSLGALAAAIVMLTTGFYAADPIFSVLIGMVILWSAWGLLRRTVAVLMEETPPGIDLPEVRDRMLEVPGVRAVHDLHIWALTSGFVAMSAHVVAERDRQPAVLSQLRQRLHDQFGIAHTTLQIETDQREMEEEVHCVGDPRCLPVESLLAEQADESGAEDGRSAISRAGSKRRA